MNLKIKIFCALSTLLLLCPTLLSCTKATAYADDVPCSELMDKVVEQIPVDFGYETYGGEQIRYYFDDTERPDDHCLRYSVKSEDLNEVGIFHTPDRESQEEVVELVEDYLEELREDQRAFIESYAAEELPKLDGAQWRTFGNYTVYAILDDHDRELVFDTVEKELKQ